MTIAEWRKKVPVTKASKFNNKKTELNGVMFDSKKEAKYMQDLECLVTLGEVTKIERQVRIRLDVNGVHIAVYVLDFRVTYADGHVEYIDVKGYRNPKMPFYRVYLMKKRLVEALHGITITEV